MEVDYNTKLYHRDDSQRAPSELKKIFPLGKSPILEVDYHDGKEPKKLAESGHIVNYLVKRFDTKKRVTPKTEDDEDSVDYFVNFAEGTFAPHLTYLVVHKTGLSKAPFYAKPVIGAFVSKLDELYGVSELKLCIDFLEDGLKKKAAKNKTDETFFVGDSLTGADIMMFFNVQAIIEGKRLGDDVSAKYPYLTKFLKQMKARPAYIRSQEEIKRVGKNKFPTGVL